jgi:hypothetical protein
MLLFHAPTERIYHWIKQQPSVKEESLTDWMLFELSERSHRLRYYAFTRNEEKLNGADWEWWVLAQNYAYRFRVQAKKLKSTADNYSSICYSNEKGMQIELLLNAAESDGAYPLYMFYSSEEQSVDVVFQHYPCPILIDMIKWCSPCNTGAFLSPAKLVYSEVFGRPKQRQNASALLNISLKLSCLDWLLRSRDAHIINDEVERLLNTLYQDYYQGEKTFLHNKFRYTYDKDNYHNQKGTIPKWVYYLSAGKKMQSSLELSDWFENEFQRSLPNVTGVAVIDLREGL